MNKAHQWDQLSIRKIKACGNSISFPFKFFFKSMINESVFPENWKKIMLKVMLFHFIKSNKKNFIKNYRPISNIPLFSKVFERLVFNAFFNFFL